jgi:hypothetical protein
MSEWAQLRWVLGGEARIVSVSAEAITLESTTPSPPGSRIDGALLAGSGRTVRVKVHASKKDASGKFRIDGRPIDLTKEAREELVALASAATAPV